MAQARHATPSLEDAEDALTELALLFVPPVPGYGFAGYSRRQVGSAYVNMLRDDPLAVAAVFRRELVRRERA